MRTVKVYVRESTKNGEVVVPPCMPCRFTKNILDQQGTEYETINILEPENHQIWKDLQAAGHRTLPVVVVSHNGSQEGGVWCGFKPEKLYGLRRP